MTFRRPNNSLFNEIDISNKKKRKVIKQYVEINDEVEVVPIILWEG